MRPEAGEFPELVTASDSKHQSAPDWHGHQVEHSTRREWGGGGLGNAQELVQNDVERRHAEQVLDLLLDSTVRARLLGPLGAAWRVCEGARATAEWVSQTERSGASTGRCNVVARGGWRRLS